MTRRVLLALLEVRGGALVWCAVVLALPLLLPAALFMDFVRGAERRALEERVLGQATVRCARQHEVPAFGAFRCVCGTVEERHGFDACSACGTRAAAIGCPCGLPARNPLFRPEDA